MDKLRYIVRELVKRQLREANVTANLDGGEGPPKTPFTISLPLFSAIDSLIISGEIWNGM